uniref:proline-rich protein 36 n=1 Tax=Odobenus rosmarus divergens TaxID=9708 RepID=UPI00063C48DD|nr:PREDICTED: proline-rich protein 36 [Odobenus rosmarus divergens]
MKNDGSEMAQNLLALVYPGNITLNNYCARKCRRKSRPETPGEGLQHVAPCRLPQRRAPSWHQPAPVPPDSWQAPTKPQSSSSACRLQRPHTASVAPGSQRARERSPPTHLGSSNSRDHKRLREHQASGALQLCQALVAPGSREPRPQTQLRAGRLRRPGGSRDSPALDGSHTPGWLGWLRRPQALSQPLQTQLQVTTSADPGPPAGPKNWADHCGLRLSIHLHTWRPGGRGLWTRSHRRRLQAPSAPGQLSRPQRRDLPPPAPPPTQAPTSSTVTLAWEDPTSGPVLRAHETGCLPQGPVADLPTPNWLGGPAAPAAPASNEAPANPGSCLAWCRPNPARRIQTPGPPQCSPPPGWLLWTQGPGPPMDVLL